MQHDLVAQRAADEIPDQLLLLEHQPVLTLGRQSDPAHILAAPDELASRGIEVIRVERGGEVTYHGPGQLVAYPIVQARRPRHAPAAVRARARAVDDRDVPPATASRRESARRLPRRAGATPTTPTAAQDRRAGPARRARRELPRHRAERHDRLGGLRADRPLRPAAARGDVDRPRGRLAGDARRGALDCQRGDCRRSVRAMPSACDLDAASEAGRSSEPAPVGGLTMPRGLFELRKDAITGWWVAVVVDREFDRARFARPAEQLDQPTGATAPTAPTPRRRRRAGADAQAGRVHPSPAPSASSARPADGDGREPGPRPGRRRRLVPDDRRAAGPPRVVRARPRRRSPSSCWRGRATA